MPKSQIVFGTKNDDIFKKYQTDNMDLIDLNNDMILLKLKCYEFYLKYIVEWSDYQINISFEIRNEFNNYFSDLFQLINSNMNPNDISNLFIKCSQEMKKLLYFSLQRHIISLN